MRTTARALAPLLVVALLAGCMSNTQSPPPGPPAAPGPQDEAPAPATWPPVLGLPITSKPTRVSDGSEPMILADLKGKYLWIADTEGVYYSTDNGTRWAETTGYPGDFSAVFGDGPGLAQDEQGRLYKAVLHDDRLDVARSDDGTHFGHVSYVAGVPVDRPWIGARGTTVVVVYLNNLGAIGVGEACTRSVDSGTNFNDRNPLAGTPGAGGLYMAPDKSFYFATGDGELTRHQDTCAGSGDTKQVLGAAGVNSLLAVAGQDAKVFIAAAGSGNKMQVGGLQTWSAKPVLYTVSPPELKTNTYGAVAARGDDVVVAWYGSTSTGDPSVDGFSGTFDVYVALIRDYFGDSQEPTIQLWKASPTPNHRGPICMGGISCTGNRGLLDYFGVTFDIWGGIHVAYVDDLAGDARTYHVQIIPEGEGVPLGGPLAVPTAGPTPTGGPSISRRPGDSASAPLPVARITGDRLGLSVHLDASTSTGAAPLSYAWDLGDGSRLSGVSINHTYAASGEYTIRLTVTDVHGREASTKATIQATEGGGGSVQGDGAKGSPGLAFVAVPLVALAVVLLRRRA